MTYDLIIHLVSLGLGICCLGMTILTFIVTAFSERGADVDEEKRKFMDRYFKAACLLLIVSGVWRD